MHSIHTLIFMSLLTVSVTGCDNRAELPSRKDCIVMVSVNPASDLKSVSPDPDLLVQKSRELSIPMGGTAYSKEGQIYLQFSAQCDAREANAKKLMQAIFGTASNSFDYQSKGIVPGPDTIDVMGASWREERGAPFRGN